MAYQTSPQRFLAPLALLAALLATFVVLRSGGGEQGSSSPARQDVPAKVAPKTPKARGSYTVRSGDTLSGIAARTGIALESIQALNPDVDAQALHAGQKIRLAAR